MSAPIRYNYDLILSLQEEFNVTLSFTGDKDKLNNTSRISGTCVIDGCEQKFDKPYRKLVLNKLFLCPGHTKEAANDKLSRTITKNYEDALERGEDVGFKFSIAVLDDLQAEWGTPLVFTCEPHRLNAYSRVAGECVIDGCEKVFEKSFRDLHENKVPMCEKHTTDMVMKAMGEKVFENFGVRHIMHDEATKNMVTKKRNETMLEKYDTTVPLNVPGAKEKYQETSMKNWGTVHPTQNDEFRAEMSETGKSDEVQGKFKETCMSRYQATNPMKNPEIKEKHEQTMMERYQTKNPLEVPGAKERAQETSMKNWKTPHPSQSDVIKERKIETSIKNWGTSHPSQNEVVKEKTRETSMKNWQTPNPMQNSEVAEKSDKNSFKPKFYTFNDGVEVQCQGYEPFALKILEESGYTSDDIVTRRALVPKVFYKYAFDFDRKPHRYFMDIYVPNLKLAIEVKSTRYLNKNREKIIESRNMCMRLGLQYVLWVFTEKGVKIPNNKILEYVKEYRNDFIK